MSFMSGYWQDGPAKGMAAEGEAAGPAMVSASSAVVVLVSPDLELSGEVQRSLERLGVRLEVLPEVEAALMVMGGLEPPSVVVLDARLPGMLNGGLLAMMQETGVHERCPVALIAEQVSDEWIARLREGVIDDIVPRYADESTWNTHLNTMQRGHTLHCELKNLRETSLKDLEHDRVTGVFNREAMLSILFRETDRVQRLRGALCTVLFDVDDFKHWSGELGQAGCDDLLRQMAARTGRILRTYDLLGRVSETEFLLALPGCSSINGVMLAERMRMEVFGEPFPVHSRAGEARLVRLTASYAITASRGRSPVVVLREAEATLEKARGAGPDSIQCSGDGFRGGDRVQGAGGLEPVTFATW